MFRQIYNSLQQTQTTAQNNENELAYGGRLRLQRNGNKAVKPRTHYNKSLRRKETKNIISPLSIQ